MKIIFLDIDGVLNLYHKGHDKYGQLFTQEWVDNLKRIIDATGAKIVISSTWRHSGLKEMQQMWKDRNLPGEVIDITPDFGRMIRKEFQYNIPRGCEIEDWLQNQGFNRINWDKEKFVNDLEVSKVKHYIILDDDSDMLYNQREHFVQTSRNWNHTNHNEGFGLTDECTEQAIKILNTSIENLYYEC